MKTLVLPDTTIAYDHDAQARASATAGSAGRPALVFVHGAQCTHADWRMQWPHFARTHEVVAPDLHGHGASAATPGRIRVECFAEDVLTLCDHLGLKRVVLIGHSMGCRVLLQSWANAPQRIAGLVFVDGAYLVPDLLGDIDAATRATLAEESRARTAAVFAGAVPGNRARHGFAQMFYDPRHDALRDEIIARAAALPPYVVQELMPGFAAWDVLHLESNLAGIGRAKVPMLVIASTYMNAQRERVTLAPGVMTPWLRAVEALAPHADVLRHHGWGHFPMLEEPGVINAEIEGFLAAHGLA